MVGLGLGFWATDMDRVPDRVTVSLKYIDINRGVHTYNSLLGFG